MANKKVKEIFVGDRIQLYGDQSWWVVTQILSHMACKAAREDRYTVTHGKAITVYDTDIKSVRHTKYPNKNTLWLALIDNKSSKFWTLRQEGNFFSTTWGRIGTTGQVTVKKFNSPNERGLAAEYLLESKLNKGYELLGIQKGLSNKELSDRLANGA